MSLPKAQQIISFPPSRTSLSFRFFFLIYVLFLAGCDAPSNHATLESILSKGEITVITRNNSHCYYLYRDQAMGFEYDLAKAFADFLGVTLEVKIAEKWEGMIPSLKNGTGAFIAASFTKTPRRQQQVAFSRGYLTIQQHIIVHRKNQNIKNIADLVGKTIHVRRGTSYQERLEQLIAEGYDLTVELHDDIPTEELIQQVEEEKIEVTIADSNIAFRNRRYYPKIIVSGAISPEEHLGWAVHPGSTRLQKKINSFFKEIKKNGAFQKIYNRYYADVDDFDFVDLRAFHRRLKSRLPRYRPTIKEAAQIHGFDWRMIAAQMYQESHFDPMARSHSGAYSLMQLTRSTAKSLGVVNILNSRQNIHAGVQHLRNMYDLFDKIVGSDRLFMALAAYNIGQGHIQDARKLARQMKLDPDKWASLAKTLPLLSYRKYYQKAEYGYCRGTEPIEYVRQIMIYYDILRHQGIEYRTDLSPVIKQAHPAA
ncbi:MAG: membrane-bound lytic murein transglycosylase MltF [Desulfobacterales bacterium]|nr:membrane-bound lytic murein transglycosylase MltF [Desulfobacterales bacterium]